MDYQSEEYKNDVFDKIENQMTNIEQNNFIHHLKQNLIKSRNKGIQLSHDNLKEAETDIQREAIMHEIRYLNKMNDELRRL